MSVSLQFVESKRSCNLRMDRLAAGLQIAAERPFPLWNLKR